jgi:hypothetical protein
MTKRNVATILWFLAGWSGGGLVAGLLGLPAIAAFVPGLLIAALVRWDPSGLFWPRTVAGPRTVPIDEFAGQLDQNAGVRSGSEPDRSSV